jgi:hypothetical protein
MRSLLGVALLAALAVNVEAQEDARPPGGGSRSRVVLTEGAQPNIADPSGIYVGEVSGYIESRQQNRNGYFNIGVFTITLTTVDCADCEKGQFRIFSQDGFSGMEDAPDSYPGRHEVGAFLAYINPNGGMIDVAGFVDNCTTVNPNDQDLSPLGEPCCHIPDYFQGGHEGEHPGASLQVVGDQIRGRISGRNCFSEGVYADIVLTKGGR